MENKRPWKKTLGHLCWVIQLCNIGAEKCTLKSLAVFIGMHLDGMPSCIIEMCSRDDKQVKELMLKLNGFKFPPTQAV